MTDRPPKYGANSFQCPHCETVSQQSWFAGQNASDRIYKAMQMIYHEYRTRVQSYDQDIIREFLQSMESELGRSINAIVPKEVAISVCSSCEKPAVWIQKVDIYPNSTPVEYPNEDLSDEIKKIYAEAAVIVKPSPRGAAALLRLALQKLLIQLGKDGKKINNDIKELVSEGLSPKIQQALDLMRVIGNNAVHPGQIDIDDNSDIALKLFQILNMIAYEMISRPNEINQLYENLIPDDTKDHIKDRDGSDR